ncbi:flagellar basal-body rod protein FlgF [Dongia sp.]|uniref:flagellar basal-body rod protein FlgF n=1 Tax=Dongia sp. TaxID=1977262 RepID=UPI0035AF8D08
METPTYIVLSRQLGLSRQMDVVANNLANTNTPGFKAEGMVFSEYLIKAEKPVKLSYVQDLASYRDMREGNIQTTGNDLDVAIQGKGFFVVQTTDGPRYTRNGRFQLNAAGEIVTSGGFRVLAGGAPLIVNTDDGPITVASDGTVSADRTQGGNTPVIYGKLDVVTFNDDSKLTPDGSSMFASEEAPAQATVADFKVQQRMIEGSNVESIREMTSMIWVQRNYQSAQKFLEGEHERMRRAVNYIIPSS